MVGAVARACSSARISSAPLRTSRRPRARVGRGIPASAGARAAARRAVARSPRCSTTWSACAWVQRTCVISIPSRSARRSSSPSRPFASISTPGRRPVGDEVGVREPAGMLDPLDDHRKRDHAADPVLGLHQLEAAVDLVEGERVRDERLDVDLAGQPAVDQLRDLVAALDAAERGAGDAAAGDQEARDDVERLALAGDAGDRARGPSPSAPLRPPGASRRRCRSPRRCSRRRSRRSSRGPARRRPRRRRSCRSRPGRGPARAARRRGRRRRSARRPAGGSRRPRRGRPCRRRRRRRSCPAATFAVLIAAPRPVERPQAKRQACSNGASGSIFASAISGITVYSAKVEHAHEVADRLAVAREPGRPVGEVALVLLLADRQAEVRPRVEAVDALAALRREERDDVVAGRERA